MDDLVELCVKRLKSVPVPHPSKFPGQANCPSSGSGLCTSPSAADLRSLPKATAETSTRPQDADLIPECIAQSKRSQQVRRQKSQTLLLEEADCEHWAQHKTITASSHQANLHARKGCTKSLWAAQPQTWEKQGEIRIWSSLLGLRVLFEL